ncbi:MAG: DUF4294 domain-containing protein [Rikenellaceae bacterium]|nr:DUF4294 domain-containing protein [Rikenellaceae bacterium]
MKRVVAILIFVAISLSVVVSAEPRRPKRYHSKGGVTETQRDSKGNEYLFTTIDRITIYGSRRDFKKFERMVRAVKKVYPLAKEASRRMEKISVNLEELKRRDRKKYTSEVEEALKKEITPMLWKMTRYEGVILLKLIDRETDKTAFSIIKLYRSGFVAGFYQTLARLFGNNLKLEYDPEGEDQMLEQIVRLYEAGEL